MGCGGDGGGEGGTFTSMVKSFLLLTEEDDPCVTPPTPPTPPWWEWPGRGRSSAAPPSLSSSLSLPSANTCAKGWPSDDASVANVSACGSSAKRETFRAGFKALPVARLRAGATSGGRLPTVWRACSQTQDLSWACTGICDERTGIPVYPSRYTGISRTGTKNTGGKERPRSSHDSITAVIASL